MNMKKHEKYSTNLRYSWGKEESCMGSEYEAMRSKEFDCTPPGDDDHILS